MKKFVRSLGFYGIIAITLAIVKINDHTQKRHWPIRHYHRCREGMTALVHELS